MPYRLRFDPQAEREFDKLPRKVQERLMRAIVALSDRPRPPGTRKLVGGRGEYRIRIGQYRVLYEVDDAHGEVVVDAIRLRARAYDDL